MSSDNKKPNSKSETSTSKNNATEKPKTGVASANMPKVPTARERVKDMDVKRLSDAQINELQTTLLFY